MIGSLDILGCFGLGLVNVLVLVIDCLDRFLD